MLPFGGLGALATGPLFRRLGLVWTMLLFEIVSLAYLIPVLIHHLPLQYLTFVAVAFLRPFTFAVVFNAVSMLFGTRFYGILTGTLFTLGGIASLVQVMMIWRVAPMSPSVTPSLVTHSQHWLTWSKPSSPGISEPSTFPCCCLVYHC